MKSSEILIQESIKYNRSKIGNDIRKIRELRGYSQDYLADIMNVDRSTISKIENGKFSFSIDYLTKISLALKFEIKLVDKY
jgi:transcriptional regulator with XRE-family HTH domain